MPLARRRPRRSSPARPSAARRSRSGCTPSREPSTRSITSLSVSVHGEPSLRGYENLRAASSDASTLSSSAFTSATLLSLRHRIALGPPRDAIREAAHHVHRDQQAQIARRRREILPRAGRLEDRRAVRHARVAAPAVLELAPVLDRGHARLHLLFERRDRLRHRAQRIERRRRHHVVHAIVEVFDRRACVWSSEKSPYCGCFAISALVSRRKAPFLSRTIGRKRLKPGLAERGILREQEIAAPEALARDRPVGLRVDGEEDAGRAARSAARAAPAPAGARRDRRTRSPGAACPRSAARGSSRCCRRSRACARSRNGRRRRRSADTSRTPARAPAGFGGGPCGRFAAASALRRRRCAGRRRAAGRPNRSAARLPDAAWPAAAGAATVVLGRRWARLEILDVPPREAPRRLAAAAARALRVAERQPHLEREIGAQEVRKVGAVGANDHLHRVFVETQMVEQEIARPVAQHFMQRRPRRRRVERRVEQLLDPGGIQIFRRAIPGIAQRPDAAVASRAAAAARRRARRSRA